MRGRDVRSHKMEPRPCPTCGEVLNVADGFHDEERQPADGDLSICLFCGSLMVIEGASFRTLTHEEQVEADASRNVQRVVRVVRMQIRERELVKQTEALVAAAIAGRRSRLN